jgi:hypothetical protein
MRINARFVFILWPLVGCQRAGLPSATAPSGATAALESACAFAADADPARAVLAFNVGDQLKLAFADGTARTVHTFGAQLPSTGSIGRVDDVQGDRILAEANIAYQPAGAPSQRTTELVLLDRQGNVVWQRTAAEFGTARLGTDGTLAVSDGQDQTLVVARDGTERTLAGQWSPIAPAPDGSLLVQAPPPGGDGSLGWLRPGRDTVERLSIQPNGDARWVGDRVAYLGYQNALDVVVFASPEKAQVVPLPQGYGQSFAITGVAGPWLEVQRYGGAALTLLRVDARTGAVDELRDAPPSGTRRFDGGGLALPQPADDGSLIGAFRNDYIGNLYRSTDGGASWTPFGFSVANVLALDLAVAAGGTFVVQSSDQQFYLPAFGPWSDPPPGVTPELTGRFVQLARPGDGVRYPLPALAGDRSVALGSSGRCASYWALDTDKKSARLEVLDVVHDRRTQLATADVQAINAPLWIER